MTKIIVPVSGGKDSQSCLKIAVSEVGADQVLGLFCDTKFEHPKTYAHVEKLKDLYGAEIVTINAGSVPEKVKRYGRFPGGGARHCTDELKIQPTKNFLKSFAEENGPVMVYYGMRMAESPERQKRYENKTHNDLYPPHEIMPRKYPKYLYKMGVTFKLPILMWTNHQVFEFLGGRHNPLYDAGFDRVGCFPCLASGDPHKERAFCYDDFGRAQRVEVKYLEEYIGKSVFTSKGGAQRNNEDQITMFDDIGCSVCSI